MALPDYEGGGPFERVLYALTMRTDCFPRYLGVDIALLAVREALVILARPSPRIAEALPALARQLPSEAVELLLVGGEADLVELWPKGPGIGRWHWPEGGEATLEPDGWEGPLAEHLRQHPDGGEPPDWEHFYAVMEPRIAQYLKEQREQEGFSQRMQRQRVVAVPALLTGIAAVWAMEQWLGAPDWLPAVMRLGAFAPSLVEEGQLWRIVSYAWMHGSWMHLFANGYVLWRMGSEVERLVGSERMLVAYTLGALGGGLMSQLFVDGISTGASGAIWALLGVQATMVFGNRSQLPPAVAAQARSAVIQNIVLNLLLSVLPGINWAAHLGGLFGGVLGTLLTRLPFYSGRVQRGLATASALLLVLPLLVGWAVERPWELRDAPALYPTRVVNLELPLPESAVLTGESWQVGDPLRSPLLLELHLLPLPEGLDAEASGWMEERLANPPEDFPTVVARQVRSIRGQRVHTATYENSGGGRIETALRLLPGSPGRLLWVDSYLEQGSPALLEGYAAQVAAEARSLP
ncbi:MAG TPA: rhomboid family intramembrane serine protease [Myxococcota bacterium]|nr:rhomboid family intramembrane serine protease [Myxococcota bacterium]